MSNSTVAPQAVHWLEQGEPHSAQWRAESGAAPENIVVADDQMTADAAYRLAKTGTALLWRGDFQNARQLLQALARRVDRQRRNTGEASGAGEAFQQHRQAQGRRADILNKLLLPLNAGYSVPLRRAPDVRQACSEAYGPATVSTGPSLISLRELQGVIGAHEWRKKGAPVAALNARIHPHYGVFAPVRGEYVGLVNDAPLPAALAADSLAFDIGTGTGVLAAVLAKRGIAHIIATDQNPRALTCARENLARLGLADQVTVVQADLFPAGRAPLIVCNPPWVPAQPNSALDEAIFDPGSRMLRGFLAGLAAHLTPGGEGWLVLSDIAEHLGLRTRDELLAMIASAGLTVAGRMDVRPSHKRVRDMSDPLYAARAAEVTSLWRLVVRKPF
ncbi:MAG: class I SAM-dependent methyltransferase [Rugosibacter sp.]